ncbi:hypothetical protein [Pedobacter cryoconitis]|uniref:Uncharacterized protein n=1 Tax=Pedobacter cryoconitis TaxID=188932 RepID=A0A7X0J154_9SPHI|nr:hypothetical protein [Pedobacter cryoconitis]MBB6499184.1 hypothetical protein [Pedobacter cryoconitis]
MDNIATPESIGHHHHPPKPVDPPISLEEAKDRAKRWSDLLGELPYFSGRYAQYKPKALFIPLPDLLALIEHHKKHDKHLSGIRVYFGLTEDTTPIYPDPPTFRMRGSIVAVGMDQKDIITKTGEGAENGIGDIYDFTAPCPDLCDTASPLF